MMTDAKSHMEYFTFACEHVCPERKFSAADIQGVTLGGTSIGLRCACGDEVRLGLSIAKALPKPIQPYLLTTEARLETLKRINEDPKTLLSELMNSGGWFQPDPGVAKMTAMAAFMGPEGNPMQKKLEAMFDAQPKTS
jgi:hypothetical protein